MRRLLFSVVLLILAIAPTTDSAVSMSNTEWASRYWAQAYGLNPTWFWDIALCESGGNYTAYNASGPYYGAFQFDIPTYYALRTLLNNDPRLAPNLSYPDPEDRDLATNYGAPDAHVAAWAIANGYLSKWPVCG